MTAPFCVDCRHATLVPPGRYFCARAGLPRDRVTGDVDKASAPGCETERYPGPAAAPGSVCGPEAIYFDAKIFVKGRS